MVKFDLEKYPDHLRKLCERPEPRWLAASEPDTTDFDEDIVARFSLTPADVPYLVDIAGFLAQAEDEPLPDSCYHAAANAWDALIRLGNASLLPSLLAILQGIDWDDFLYGYPFVTEAVASCAVDHIDELISLFQDETREDNFRALLADALVVIQERRPASRDLVANTLMAELSGMKVGRRDFYDSLARALLHIPVPEAIPLIRASYLKGLLAPSSADLLEENGADASERPLRERIRRELLAVARIIDAFKCCGTTFPHQAIHDARRHRAMLVPALIEGLRESIARARCGQCVDPTFNLFAVHLFGEFQAKEALPYVLDSLSLTDDRAWNLYLEGLHESMPGIVYRLAGDDFDFYDRRIRSPETPYVLRRCLISSLYYLVKSGLLDRESLTCVAREYFRTAVDESQPDYTCDTLDLLLDCGDLSDFPLICEAFAKDLIDEKYVALYEAREMLLREGPDFPTHVKRHTAFDFSDTVSVMSPWFRFAPSPAPQPPPLPFHSFSQFEFPPETPPKVGRNDPCPCGSGKKYKKCCLKRK